MASDNEESLARRLWAGVRRESIVPLYTPFVVSLAAGTLDHDTFLNFYSQDHYFIECYAKSLEFVEKCAENDDAKNSVSQFKNIFLKLLEDYNFLVERWGSNYSEEHTVNPATVNCTNFVDAMASGIWASSSEKTKAGAFTLGAMMPHIQLYAFISKELQSLLDANGSSHPFKKWIDHYSSKYYQDYILQAEDLLETLSVSLTSIELDMLQKFYHQAMILELEFFSAQPMVQNTAVPLLKEHNPSEHHFMVFSDFDLTCTVLGSPDYVQSQKQIALMPSANLRNTMGLFSGEYTEEFEQYITKRFIREHEKAILELLQSEKGHIVAAEDEFEWGLVNERDEDKMSNGRQTRMSSSEAAPIMGIDLVREILARLCAKSLSRLAVTSKEWASIIRDERFNDEKSRFSSPKQKLLFASTPDLTFVDVDSLSGLSFEPTELGCPFEIHTRTIDIVGECKGLVCLTNGFEVVLCNPSLRERNSILLLQHGDNARSQNAAKLVFGFGCLPSRPQDFRVVVMAQFSYDSYPVMIGQKNKCWRAREMRRDFDVSEKMGSHLNGVLYWIADRGGKFVLTFDLTNEECGSISLPARSNNLDEYILSGVLNGFLYVICKKYVDSDYEILVRRENAWMVFLNLPTIGSGVMSPVPILLTEGEEGVLLSVDAKNLVIFDTKRRRFGEVMYGPYPGWTGVPVAYYDECVIYP